MGAPVKIECSARISSGVVQFGDDWPGLFIRGDEALGLANRIEILLRSDIDPLVMQKMLTELIEMLRKVRN